MNGRVTTSAPLRRRPVGATFNLRDVGGYPTTDGRRTRWGRLFRSDAARFTADAELAGLDLRTVVDLRDAPEVSVLPTGLEAHVPAVLSRPLDPRPLLTDAAVDSADPLGELYVAIVRARGPELARIVTDLARPGALPALVHCAAGKDRTGVVIALVLSALGVADDLVAADYALTADFLTAEFFDAVPVESGATDPADVRLRGARPESMTTLLAVLAAEHGGARSYLVGHGVPHEAIDHLRSTLTHPGDTQ
jgi:protein-tyrosine phosphatase